MNPRVVARITAQLLLLVAMTLLAPLFLAVYDGISRAMWAYLVTLIATLAMSLVLGLAGRSAATTALHRKDALGIVGLAWVCLGVLGGMPFVVEGAIASPISALFEAVSGFTTTGATVIADVDPLSRATNLWRCLSHWIGGMGIVVLFVAVFPQLGVGAKSLFRTEVPGPISEGLNPRIQKTALALWWIYAGLTGLCCGLFLLAGMSPFDAVCHAFSTLGTGGFSTHTASIGWFHSPVIEWICIVFMLIAGLNFGLYYTAFTGRPGELWRNFEVRFYLAYNAFIILVVLLCIRDRHPDVLGAVRAAAFQTAAVTSTTGFMTEDFDTYPDLARFLLFVSMFMGGCAGSTAGGLKASRVWVLLKLGVNAISSTLRPSSVTVVRLGRTVVGSDILHDIAVYTTTFGFIFAAATATLVAMGMSIESGASASIACLSSIGPGFGAVGPSQSYAVVPELGKLVLVFCMIAGRLEIFALLALFTPEAWKR
ncbi:MAG: TrkH family potassium uptake protein [Myxococcota bacterium]|jgi:trk system potassium uptake protein TrkH|nr:TrkH family potassium uptake protein [Myxococcota bacterium]